MAITVHIRSIGDDSEDEDNNIQLRIKQEDNSDSCTTVSSSPIKQPASLDSLQPDCYPTSQTSNNTILISNEGSEPLPGNTSSPTGSTTQEDTPLPILIPFESNNISLTQPLLPISSTSSISSTSRISSTQRPSTPTTTTYLQTQSTLGIMRNLTLPTTEKLLTHSTQELKCIPSTKLTGLGIEPSIDRTNSSLISTENIEEKSSD